MMRVAPNMRRPKLPNVLGQIRGRWERREISRTESDGKN
nr:MAG TPA: hypothetical protein [Caudoviricetes sp.]